MDIKSIIAQRHSGVKRKFALATATALVALLAVLAVLYYQVDRRSAVDGAEHADVIIVLGAAVWPGERPGPSLAARTQHAIALYKSGYAPYLILSGGLGQNPPSEAEAMRRLAAAAGVPADALVLEDQSHSTVENLRNSKRLMDQRGWRTALIVSEPFHLLRAETIAHDVGMQAFGSPASNSPAHLSSRSRLMYTTREAIALVWYYGTRAVGEPTWLYALLKGKI